MSNPLTRRTGDALDRASGRPTSTRLERAVRSEVELVHGRAVVQAARAQAVEFVAHSSLRAIEGLTEMETLALQRAPLGDARYKAIVDTATRALARIVAETGRPDMDGILLVLLIVVVIVGLLWLGYRAAEHDHAKERDELATQRQALDTSWAALKQIRRVNGVLFAARDAMRRAEGEARGDKPRRPPRSGRTHDPPVIDGDWE
jgi:hypothetical protein